MAQFEAVTPLYLPLLNCDMSIQAAHALTIATKVLIDTVGRAMANLEHLVIAEEKKRCRKKAQLYSEL